ncbi:hypothetical protein ACFQ3C_03930 [Seohaeicola saemankumensis]|uniref:Uncharacterized protein n=1 Tax=Seohaeicola saemankumensis TaxID=481181 RepID=A0ABW3T9D6_9RHOB
MTEQKSRAKLEPNLSKTSKRCAPDPPDDYSIWLSMDGIAPSVPWRLGSYGNGGALSDSDLLELAKQFDLPTGLLRTLSQQLGFCLDVESEVNLVEVKRSKAIERTGSDIEKALKLTETMEAAAKKLAALLEPLSTQFANSKEDAAILPAARAKAQELCSTITATIDAIDAIRRTSGSAAVMRPFNKVHVWDKRREYVIKTCCHTWSEVRRSITYTSNDAAPKGKKREGPLVDFIQAIVAKVTDPPKELRVETIRKDIDRFKKSMAKPDELTTPPDKCINSS